MNNCYVGLLLDDGHIELLAVSTEMYEPSEEMEYGTVVLCRNEPKGCAEAQGYAYCVLIQMLVRRKSCVFLVN